MEILAPAGGPEALRAAVSAGADAVYLGGPVFGARAHARNFSREELKEAVAFCHARGVRVHLTVNTVLKDRELPEAMEFVSFLCSLPVDAVLVQDMGLFSLLRKAAPELPLHASTQMSLHTPAGVRLLEELGAERVVLARELSLSEIREIRAGSAIELESFVHGALCMSVSGQCYLSAMLGGRSGNRGQCAQPCRLPFAAPGGTGSDLSLRDLSALGQIDRMREAGIGSLKIEGRMKRPEYVAGAVSACRKAVDGEPAPRELLEDLEAVFSRSGFTDGYLTGRRGVSMFGIRTKEDVTGATEKVFSSLRGLYRGERRSVPVQMTLEERDGRLCLAAEDGEGHGASVLEESPGETPPVLAAERCRAQLEKTGGTPFLVTEAEAPPEGAAVRVASLNAMRREALDLLLEQRSVRAPIPFEKEEFSFAFLGRRPVRGERVPVRACFRSGEQIPEEARQCRELALPLTAPPETLRTLKEAGYPPILLELPRGMFGEEQTVRRLVEQRLEEGFSDFLCGNLGAVGLCRELRREGKDLRIHGSFSLNITNTPALEFFRGLGLSSAEASFELSSREFAALGGSLPLGLMVYGRQALMLTRNCPLANSPKGCLHCRETGYLTDRMHKQFPVQCTAVGKTRCAELLNSVPLWLGDREKEWNTADFGVFRFTVENAVETSAVLRAYFRQETPEINWTRGLFARGVE